MGGSWDISNTASGLGKSKWLAQGNPEEMPHKSNWNCHEGATQPLSSSEPAHVSIQTYYTLFPLNKYFLCTCSVTQSCPTLCNPMDYSLPCSSVHGILQTRILEWVAMHSSSGSSQPRDQTWVSLCLLHWQADSLPLAPLGKPNKYFTYFTKKKPKQNNNNQGQ